MTLSNKHLQVKMYGLKGILHDTVASMQTLIFGMLVSFFYIFLKILFVESLRSRGESVINLTSFTTLIALKC